MKPSTNTSATHLDGLLSGHLKRRRLRQIAPFIPVGASVLDIGCDDGALLSYLPTACRYLGVDNREERIRCNQKRLGSDSISFACAEFPALDWQGPEFDRIVLAAVVEHLPALDAAFAKLVSLVSVGGLVLITTPAPVSHFILRMGAALRLFARDSLAEHKHYYRRSDFAGLAGWRVERFRRFELGLNQMIVLRRTTRS